MIDIRRLGHATFTTPDLERSRLLLGARPDRDRATRIALSSPPAPGWNRFRLERGDKPSDAQSFQVVPRPTSATMRELSEHGTGRVTQRLRRAARALVFTDLKGNAD
jgi:hypothetical protein